jgi:D-sedoheptulose 7-phosphate isomerase
MDVHTSIANYFVEHDRSLARALAQIQLDAVEAASRLSMQLLKGQKVIAFGNGGSAAQASHFAAELVGRFNLVRRPLPALALSMDGSAVTCIANDFGYESVFERQIQCLAEPGDVALGISTSGSSKNVLRGLAMAHTNGAITIALVGGLGFKGYADVVIAVPSETTSFVQEIHLVVIHAWCVYLESAIACGPTDASPISRVPRVCLGTHP